MGRELDPIEELDGKIKKARNLKPKEAHALLDEVEAELREMAPTTDRGALMAAARSVRTALTTKTPPSGYNVYAADAASTNRPNPTSSN